MARKLAAKDRRTYRTRNKLRAVNVLRNSNREVRPRLTVFRSGRQIYAQIVDDVKGVTLAAASSLDKEVGVKLGGTVDIAEKVGKLVAERAKKAGVSTVQFDRGGYVYHGRVKALAEGARAGGLAF